jgi:malate dehydrogenase (oxaloacetate-decarboxylating)(NADP+)
MFFMAARTLAREVTTADLDIGRIYPSLSRMREVSLRIAVSVAEVAWARNLARVPRPDDPEQFIRS